MISFALDFFFMDRWINFLFRMGFCCVRFAGADALPERRKSGKCKKYLCKLENKDKSISFSVKPNFKSDIKNMSTAFYIFTHDKWIKDWAFPQRDKF